MWNDQRVNGDQNIAFSRESIVFATMAMKITMLVLEVVGIDIYEQGWISD